MGALSDHHRRKLSSASSNRLSEDGRMGGSFASSSGRGLAPHLMMLVAAVVIGGVLGLAYQQLHEKHPSGGNGKELKSEPVVTAENGGLEMDKVVWDLNRDRGVLGAGIFGGGRRVREDGDKLTELGGSENSGELSGKTVAAKGIPSKREGKLGEGIEGQDGVSSGDIERTYVHQPGEVVAEDGEGGKFVVDDKDRIVFVEKEGVEHMLRGLVAKRGGGAKETGDREHK
ncbi:hypothetical protein KFL_002080040 [Klebsormidium nitens]|uniref:Uncharacterized protein n=1 Tax=Klebsormidium nitens TaxID=105231 RepID=A0A1Y1I802_KLENI|nr:hypothetical protein KFL_002080040 [Klebsormidium nitens]|eukprot:GAQ84827.1 hypothetical protein KFL_002080040 [Klebsormidium nitens]